MSDHYELRCRECGKTWGNAPRSFCEDCFSPLEVAYDYDSLRKIVRRENLSTRSFNMWRYAELLPLPEGYQLPNAIGGTPLVPAGNLATRWGVKNLFLKNDAVCFPSLSHRFGRRAPFWLRDRWLFLYGQSRQRRRRASRATRFRCLRLYSRRPRARQGPQHRRLWRADCSH
jgi:hypothetical protein